MTRSDSTSLEKACTFVWNEVTGDNDTIHPKAFLDVLKTKGLLADDPRVQCCVKNLSKYNEKLDEKTFKSCIMKNITVLEELFSESFCIPNFEKFGQ